MHDNIMLTIVISILTRGTTLLNTYSWIRSTLLVFFLDAMHNVNMYLQFRIVLLEWLFVSHFTISPLSLKLITIVYSLCRFVKGDHVKTNLVHKLQDYWGLLFKEHYTITSIVSPSLMIFLLLYPKTPRNRRSQLQFACSMSHSPSTYHMFWY